MKSLSESHAHFIGESAENEPDSVDIWEETERDSLTSQGSNER